MKVCLLLLKYLGVTISEDLRLGKAKHIDVITKTFNQTLGFLRRNIKVRNKDLKATAFKTHMRPQLECATSVWCRNTTEDIDKIESAQHRAGR